MYICSDFFLMTNFSVLIQLVVNILRGLHDALPISRWLRWVHNIIFKLCTRILKHIKCVYRFAEGLVKYKVLFLKPIRMKYDLMVVIFTILLKTWPWKQYDPVTLNIMGYCTGNMCYVVVINAQVLSYPFRRQIKIQQTCVQ